MVGVALPHAAPGDGSGITSLCARTRGKPPVACLEWRCLTLRPVMGLALPRSAPVQGVSRPPHTASRDCRTAHPSPVRSRVRLHRNAGSCGKRKKRVKGWQNDAAKKPKKPCISICVPTRSAASRAVMAGWAGEGGGRFGERREYEAPTLPSTPRQHGMARHHKSQARKGSTAHHHPSKPISSGDSRKTRLVKMRMAGRRVRAWPGGATTPTVAAAASGHRPGWRPGAPSR